ncbi:MAG: photosystem II cytochrome PsbV2 [Cyanobacteriota bacterium]|nr:photosystem II cytochrome PsbV2 [Cyanobacteriota bacterium]
MTRIFSRILRQMGWLRGASIAIAFCLTLTLGATPAIATTDRYINRFIAREPVAIPYDAQGQTKTFTPDDFYQGKELFKSHCIYCHVGGTTIQDPRISLSLEALAGATPPRNNVSAIAEFMHDPMNYDGSDYSIWCRQVTEDWMPQADLERLAAFILRAGEKSPGWGNSNVELR